MGWLFTAWIAATDVLRAESPVQNLALIRTEASSTVPRRYRCRPTDSSTVNLRAPAPSSYLTPDR